VNIFFLRQLLRVADPRSGSSAKMRRRAKRVWTAAGSAAPRRFRAPEQCRGPRGFSSRESSGVAAAALLRQAMLGEMETRLKTLLPGSASL